MTNIQQEIWKDITNFEGYYQISNLGRVRSLDRLIPHTRHTNGLRIKGRIISTNLDKDGYRRCTLRKLHKDFKIYVHIQVAEHFIGERQLGYEVNHIDHDKGNASLSNLEYITKRENITHGKLANGNTKMRYATLAKGAYQSGVCVGDKKVYLGRFKTEIEANHKAIEYLAANGITNKYATS